MAGTGLDPRRAPDVALAAMFVTGGSLALLQAMVTGASDGTAMAFVATAAVAFVLSVAFAAFRGRARASWRHGGLASGAALIATLAALNTGAASGATAGYVVWVAVYAGYFLSPRAALAHVGFAVVAVAVAVGATRPDEAFSTVVLSAANAGVVGAIVATLSSRLFRAATTDALTGLANRGTWEEAAQRELERARRAGQPVAVALLDVDGLKDLNDRHGHAAGDAALREVARACGQHLRAADLAARFGGDEFVVLLPGTDVGDAGAAVARVAAASAQPFSFGVAEHREGEDLEALVRRADIRMYEAKAARQRAAGARAGGDRPAAATTRP